jgi:hypothetical protein
MRGSLAYYEIVADAVGDLGEGVGRARCDEHNVGPAAELDVQNGISDAIIRLKKNVVSVLRLGVKRGAAHIPFIVVGPHIHSQTANVPRLEEGERWLGRCHLHGHVLVLYAHGRGDQKYFVWCVVSRTLRSSPTMRGALIDATLPVVMRRTCMCPSRLFSAAVKFLAM